MEQATFGAGCFWGVQAAFDKLDGVTETSVGYMGGTTTNPTYEQVCSNTTGHAEVVHIKYDPKIISYDELLKTFFMIHDPTQKNKQGPDIGSQYRSVIFYYNEEQQSIAKNKIKELKTSGQFKKEIATELTKASPFYKAEEYHQHYFKKNKSAACRLF
jgi:peptide-methionine (S)-S-oxide reductase